MIRRNAPFLVIVALLVAMSVGLILYVEHDKAENDRRCARLGMVYIDGAPGYCVEGVKP